LLQYEKQASSNMSVRDLFKKAVAIEYNVTVKVHRIIGVSTKVEQMGLAWLVKTSKEPPLLGQIHLQTSAIPTGAQKKAKVNDLLVERHEVKWILTASNTWELYINKNLNFTTLFKQKSKDKLNPKFMDFYFLTGVMIN
jgi:hypothetical protein